MRRLLQGHRRLKHRLLIRPALWLRPAVYGGAQHPHPGPGPGSAAAAHVRKGKGGKTGMCPWASCSAEVCRSYLEAENPDVPGQAGGRKGVVDSRYSQRGVQWAVQQQPRRPASERHLGAHPAPQRHAPVGRRLDIVSIKELLGHEHRDPMVYLTWQHGRKTPFSPLDTLFTPKAVRLACEVAQVIGWGTG